MFNMLRGGGWAQRRRRAGRDPRIGLAILGGASRRGGGLNKCCAATGSGCVRAGIKPGQSLACGVRGASAEVFDCCAAEVIRGARAAEGERFRRRRGRLGKTWPCRKSCAGIALARSAETRQVLPVIRSITTVMTLPNASSLSGLRPIHGKDCRLARSRRRDWRRKGSSGEKP